MIRGTANSADKPRSAEFRKLKMGSYADAGPEGMRKE